MTVNYSFLMSSLLVLSVILGYYFSRPRLPIRLNRAFLAILVIHICTELFEFVSTRFNEYASEHSDCCLWAFYVVFFFFYLTRGYMYFVFTISALDARGAGRSSLHRYTPVVYYACALIALSAPLNGWMFRVDGGYHNGPLFFLLYACSGSYLIFSQLAILRHRRCLNRYELISLTAMQGILLVGHIVRHLIQNYLIMNTFSLLAIVVIYLSFLNPDLFLSERGFVFNLPAFQAVVEENIRRRRPCCILGFALQNYNEHREIFGGQQMEKALTAINRYLKEAFPHMSAYYLRNGYYAVVGQSMEELEKARRDISDRFTEAWSTSSGGLQISAAFVEADAEALGCAADRTVNALFLALEEQGHGGEAGSCRPLADALAKITDRLEIRRCLENALDQGTLEVFLQPIVDARTGQRAAAEALVRLRDGQGGIIRPDLFITMAEREGTIVRLGEQVLGKVCLFLREHDMDALGVRWINVNLSPIQFMSHDIPERFAGILRQYGVSPDRIHLEITEQSMIDFSLLRDQIQALHEGGFEFALDDYGSGYSNLTRVHQYPFTNVKIDMEVVWEYFRNRDPLLPGLIQAFRQMGLSITAEGIETAEMAECMRDIGCDYLQGFHFSRPVPMDEFLRMKGTM